VKRDDLPRDFRERLIFKLVFQSRLDKTVRMGSARKSSLRSLLEPFFAVLFREAENSKARSIALLRMWAFAHDALDKLSGGFSDLLSPFHDS